MALATKTKLVEALKKSMEKKPFDKITVKELLEESNMSRPTFYYHFQDIYALMEWMFETEAVELLKKSENCLNWDDGILLLLRYIQENKKVCLCAYNSIGYDTLKHIFFKSVRASLLQFMDTLLEEIPAKTEHIAFIADFYTTAFAGSVLNWLQSGARQTPEEMIVLFDITAHGSIAEALRRSAESLKN